MPPQAAPGRYDSPIDRPDTPDYDFKPQPPAPPLRPRLVQFIYNKDLDSIYRFQTNQLRGYDEEWHRLVPKEALASLPEREIKRQCFIFEIIKSEKEYVADLETLRDVFLTPLFDDHLLFNNFKNQNLFRNALNIDFEKETQFRNEVFSNFHQILAHERRFLAALYERQLRQHPLITSVMDIILDTVLAFRADYESYITHYPLAEARHRREIKQNEAYNAFLSETEKTPRARKRDFVTFILRPVNRLFRLSQILEQVLKHTLEDHTDYETVPLILRILSDFLRSIRPGIQDAEDRVKCITLCESLVFGTAEIIDLDFDGENRTVAHEGTVRRTEKVDTSPRERWVDNSAKLLDHYFILTEQRTSTDPVREVEYFVNSHPIPLDFLRLGPFSGPPEKRKEGITTETSFSDRVFRPTNTNPMYPFVVFHAGNLRRYILYASSEAERYKWKEVLEETKNLRDVWMDGNKLFGFNVIQDGRFRLKPMLTPWSMANEGVTGRMLCATAFRRQERNFLAIATGDGIYVGLRDNLDRSVRVLQLPNVTHMIALASHDRLVLIFEKTLHAYSLEPLASVALGQVPSKPVEQTMENLEPQFERYVAFFRVGSFGDQDYLVYGTPAIGFTILHTLLITHGAFQRREGHPVSLQATAYDVYIMSKAYAIFSDKGITVLDPNDYSRDITVPDFSESSSNAAMAALESQCNPARALGIVDVSEHERLVIYDVHGCYIDTYNGRPVRDCKWVRWEIKVKSFSYRHPHLLLFGEDFIDIRHAPTGQFKQMVDAKNIRLLDSIGISSWKGSLFLEWRGSHNDKDGQSWALVEGLETAPLEMSKTPPHPDTEPQSVG